VKEIYNAPMEKQDEEDILKPVVWIKYFDLDSAEDFIKKIQTLDADPSVKEIYIYISSYGGEAMPLIAMIDSIINCSKPVNSIVLGTASSSGAFLAMSCTGTRYISPNSCLHIHHVRGGIENDSEGMKQEAKLIKQIENKIFNIIAKRSNNKITDIKNKLQKEAREWSVSPTEAKKWNFIDKIGIPKLKTQLVVTVEE
jgi:ATP-dependent Clp protease protease subunit